MPQSEKTSLPYIAFVGGPDLSLRVTMLTLLRDSGFRVSAIGSNTNEKADFDKAGIPYFFYPLKRGFSPFGDIKSILSLQKIMRSEGFDIVHAFDTKPAVIARIAAARAGTSVVVGTITGMGSLFSGDGKGAKKALYRSVYRTVQRYICKKSDMTIFQNSDDMEYFLSNRMVKKERAALIRGSGVDTGHFSDKAVGKKDRTALVKELGLGKVSVVTMISRLVRYKGIDEFIGAARLVKKHFPKTVFLLAGPSDDTLAAYPAGELKAHEEAIKYIGPRDDIATLLAISDIVTLPSYYREGVPRVLIEAASMGKPLVTTDTAGCREVVEDGRNGRLVPKQDIPALADAIIEILNDKERGKRMGAYSRQKALLEFDTRIVLKDSVELYHRLIEAKKRRA